MLMIQYVSGEHIRYLWWAGVQMNLSDLQALKLTAEYVLNFFSPLRIERFAPGESFA